MKSQPPNQLKLKVHYSNMNLHVINSNSKGNAYILQNEEEALLIECGVNFKEIKKTLRFNLGKVNGCIMTHEHGDHSISANDVMSAGVDLYASEGTHKALKTNIHHRAKSMTLNKTYSIGRFKVMAFESVHDCAEPVSFIIYHPKCGTTLFITDSVYTPFTFQNLNHVIIEANYCNEALNERLKLGTSPVFLRDRVIQSHMSLQTCKEVLKANDLSNVSNILLIHLSDGNSDESRFKREIEQQTGKMVYIAKPNLVVNFSKNIF